MNNLIHHQATRDVLKSRFGSHKRLRCKTTLQYPVSVEREYQRITNAYTKLLNDTLKRHLPEIRAAASMEEATRHDDIGDLVSIVQQWLTEPGFGGRSRRVILESKLFYIAVEDNEWSLAVELLQKEDPYDDHLSGLQGRHYLKYLDGMKRCLLDRLPSIGTRKGAWMSGTITREEVS